jgi:hypothetical protein
LYLIANRLRIVHKVRFVVRTDMFILTHFLFSQVGHVTCDNAKNNDTMLEEFARCYKLKTGSTFDIKRRHIR